VTVTADQQAPRAAARPTGIRKLPGLDGLRAIAVVAVMVYHLHADWLPGGYLGVDVFFVISGYLITSLLLSEFRLTGNLSLRNFWMRRVRRLFPALATLLLVVVLLAAVFGRDALSRLQADVPASMFYVMNWRLVFEHQSYMDSFGRPPLLQHLWSLSVEEQFYLLWPPVVLLLRRRVSRTRIAQVSLAGAVASGVLMALLYQPSNPSADYFSTETHAFGLMIGCALAASVPPWMMKSAVTPRAKRILEQSGVVALAGVVAGLVFLDFDSAITYRGGMVLVDLAAVVVVASVAHPASRLGAALGSRPLRWVGLRSYSLYLWHWPIFELLRPGTDLAWPTPLVDLLRVGLTVAAADASYRWVEQPWRQGRAWPVIKARLNLLRPSARACVFLAPALLISVLLATAPGPDEPPILSEGATAAANGRPVVPSVTVPPSITTVSKAASTTATTTATTRPAPPMGPGGVPASTEPILAIGDSVLLAASPKLTATFGPDITVDASVGRHVNQGVARLQTYAQSGALSHYRTVVIDLGTNGTYTAQAFAEMAAILANTPHVINVTVYAARSWTAPDNAVIESGTAAHPGQMMLDNWSASAGQPGILYPDGIHPNPTGSSVYTQLLQRVLIAAGTPPAPTPPSSTVPVNQWLTRHE
jgi:peptidoglycan/LPS O-acetylase OafA/YrhL